MSLRFLQSCVEGFKQDALMFQMRCPEVPDEIYWNSDRIPEEMFRASFPEVPEDPDNISWSWIQNILKFPDKMSRGSRKNA